MLVSVAVRRPAPFTITFTVSLETVNYMAALIIRTLIGNPRRKSNPLVSVDV